MRIRNTIAAALVSATGVAAFAGAPVDFYLTVLHSSDGESQIINAGPGALADFGGLARFATVVDNLRAQAAVFPAGPEDKGALLISSGDNFLAGPEFDASLTNGVPFFDSKALDLIGYDAMTIGNHEFDFGPDVLEDFIAGFTGSVKFLSSNLDFTGEPGLQSFVDSDRIVKSAVFTVNGRQVGVIGATTQDLPFISTPRDVVVNAVLPAVLAEEAALHAAGVDIIILSSHLQGISTEAALVPSLTHVDLVIAGGGGELLADPGDLLVPGDAPAGALGGVTGTGYPRFATDMDGQQIPVVSVRGDYRYVGRVILGFDASGNLLVIDSASGPVRVSGVAPDAVVADPMIQAMVVDPVAAYVSGLAANVIALSEVPLNGVTNDIRSLETNLGNLAADSTLWAARTFGPAFGAARADVAFQNGGGIRNNNVLPAGNFTELNTFEILPFSNFTAVAANIPPQQFKEIMENAVSRVGTTSGTGRFAQIAGFRMTFNPAGTAQVLNSSFVVTTPGTRVREIVLNDGRVIVQNGQVVPGAPSVNVASIDFLFRGGDQYPFRGAPFTIIGVSYQQALEAYVTQHLSGLISSLRYRVGGEGRIVRTTSPFRTCASDLDGDGIVGAADLAAMLGAWGQAGSVDLDGNNRVDSGDLAAMLGAWGACD